ncbi:MAG: hypothetical protein GX958_12395 [Desulfitobacterium sp.]|nr:hypothetical protein [Desulfitobacterium sp.]
MKKKLVLLGLSLFMTVFLIGCNTSGNEETNTLPSVSDKEDISLPVITSKEGEPMTNDEIKYYLAKIEANLTVERTGYELLPDSLQRFKEFAEADDGKPFYMINLIREHQEPQYPANWQGERAKTVQEAKMLYSKACYPIMKEAGSSSMFGVNYAYPAVFNTGIEMKDWDQFYLINYPNRKAFMELLASDPYADAIVHKYAGDKDTLLIPVTAGELDAKEPFSDSEPMTQEEVEQYLAKYQENLSADRTGKPLDPKEVNLIRKFAEADDGKPFYMINLIQEYDEPNYPENWQGEKAETVLDAKMLYSKACYPIMMNTGSYSLFGVTFTGPAVVNSGGDFEDWDQFYLISYPNRRAFMELLVNEAYADAIVHKYAGDKETLLIPVTAGEIAIP